jgi:alanine racemase
LSWTRQQLEAFKGVLTAANKAGISIPLPHAANSAASMRLPEAHFKAIRLGISMYGLTPSDECPLAFELRPALSLKSTVGRVRVLPAGAGISYGRTFVTDTPTPVALVPVGYGDGYHRLLSNQASVLIHGQRCRILGRVCMDQFVVDISQVAGVQQDDEVVLIGRQGNEQIPAEEIARLAQTINYEVTTSLLPRVARVYLRDSQAVETNILGID